MIQENIDRYMTAPVAARHFGISKSAIYMAMLDGRLKFVQMGKIKLIDIADIPDGRMPRSKLPRKPWTRRSKPQ